MSCRSVVTVSARLNCQVKANDPSVITGYLSMSLDKKTWHRRWFSVHSDFVLYSFKAHQVNSFCYLLRITVCYDHRDINKISRGNSIDS